MGISGLDEEGAEWERLSRQQTQCGIYTQPSHNRTQADTWVYANTHTHNFACLDTLLSHTPQWRAGAIL